MGAAERLSALDAAFVRLDAFGTPYHVGAVMVFDRAPLTLPGGDLDLGRLRAYIGAAIDRLPRYRQRIGRVPLLGHPVWVDDPDFHLDRHVRRAALPAPGSPRQLDELVSGIFSVGLEPDRPPWQLWVVDGLAGDGFAIVCKVHHCMVDGFSGVKLLLEMLRGTPDATLPPRLASPTERASGLALLRAELAHRAAGLRALPGRLPGKPLELLRALGALLARGLRPASDAGINPLRIRRVRTLLRLQMDLEEIKRIRHAAGATVNDVVLAVMSGALRRFLQRRKIDLAGLPDFRAMVPASTHEASDQALSGNRVALLLVPLPLAESDPAARLDRVRKITAELKNGSAEVAAGEALVRLSDVTFPALLPGVLALSLAQRGFNVIITNVPGPPFPLYLLGARLRSFHPIVNLWPRQTLAVAVASYCGTLYVGLHGDHAAAPDLGDLAGDVEAAYAELSRAFPAPKAAAPRAAG